jgi:hypothetical protein
MTATPSAAVAVRTASDENELKRRDYTERQLAEPGHDLADLTDVEFENGIKRLKTVQSRMKRILEEALVVDVHYGKESDSRGNPVFKKNRLKKAGAEELRRLMKLRVSDIAPPVVVMTDELVSVTVTCGIFDSMGRMLCEGQGACNTKEKRFRRFDKKGWIYEDPREEYHNCLAMARKRVAALLTSEASGATGFFADADGMEAAEEEDRPITPWTPDEEKRVIAACQAKGIGRQTYAKLREEALGRVHVGSGADVEKLLAVIAAYTRPTGELPNGRAVAGASDDAGITDATRGRAQAVMQASRPAPVREPGEEDEDDDGDLGL